MQLKKKKQKNIFLYFIRESGSNQMQISWSVFPWVSTHLPVCDVRKMMGRPHQSPKAIYNIIEKSAGFQNINFQAHCIYYSLHCYFLHYVVSFFFPNCKVLIFILFVFCNKWFFYVICVLLLYLLVLYVILIQLCFHYQQTMI